MPKSSIKITEIEDFDIKGGYVVDGFSYDGHAGSIAAESMIRTSDFKFVGFIDSDSFPSIGIIRDGIPTYPVNIFVNEKLKTAVIISHLLLSESFSRDIATSILEFARKHKCKQIISSMKFREKKSSKDITAIGNTENARKILKKLEIGATLNATMPGIPGMLLVQGRFSNQDVIVLIYPDGKNENSDLEYGAKLCLTIGMLIPNLPCNLKLIEDETVKAEKMIKKTQKDTRNIKDVMYG
ncbi:PAC2 family protein [Nitrosopumilus sp. b2]|uniref:proteasome assembly chaperone family protein n=1 Tax=Nitrosopumilus sp. b2 TaxID=2109908 RepID=UPI0015F46794|nr:PAC2 family protein [Nitrosopumilus sp. b2]KAF6245200.1 proteasome assembly chaperone family protein [Nitrosopumilus sp. b2]